MLIGIGLFVLGAGAGCARDTTHRVVQTEQAHTHVAVPAAPAAVTEYSEREVTTVREPSDDEPRGVLSTTVHFIGEVLALPFRLVGSLLRAIF
jgi:hypothetical protein